MTKGDYQNKRLKLSLCLATCPPQTMNFHSHSDHRAAASRLDLDIVCHQQCTQCTVHCWGQITVDYF